MDIAGSSLAMLSLAPAFCVIAVLVKVTSKGPVLFKQQRLGQFGRPFTYLKFRSMYANDPSISEILMKSGDCAAHQPSGTIQTAYTMIFDPRVTRFGRFLRRTSLDELPQFLSVLKGDMSLVGPRPLSGAEAHGSNMQNGPRAGLKPGITGLWQVSGRDRSSYDEMIRLDADYSRLWSVWLDVKVLFKTPWAVLAGSNATSVSRPPGWIVGQCAAWLLSPNTVQQIVNPIISDLQINYFEALAEGRPVKASWVRLRGYWELFKAVGLVGVFKTIMQLWNSIK